MKTLKSRLSKFRILSLMTKNIRCIILIILCFSLFIGSNIYSAEPKTPAEKIETPKKFNVGDFVYVSENKRDPFEPLYLLRVKQDKGPSVSKKGYELEELKLVGILKADKIQYAMMENMQGKGINFKKGDFLNNNLWVLDILSEKVILGYRIKGETKRIEVTIPNK